VAEVDEDVGLAVFIIMNTHINHATD
jgi:hypothetical protein